MSEKYKKDEQIYQPLPCKILDNKNTKLQCNQHFYVVVTIFKESPDKHISPSKNNKQS